MLTMTGPAPETRPYGRFPALRRCGVEEAPIRVSAMMAHRTLEARIYDRLPALRHVAGGPALPIMLAILAIGVGSALQPA